MGGRRDRGLTRARILCGAFVTIRANFDGSNEARWGRRQHPSNERGPDDRPGFDPKPASPRLDDAQAPRRHHRRRRGPRPRQDARSRQHHGARNRLHHRRRDLRSDRHRGGALRGSGHHAVVRDRRHSLRFRRPLLRRTRSPDAGRRQHLHLYLRHARRDFCLDYRLGPHPRIRHGRLDRGGRLVGLSPRCCAISASPSRPNMRPRHGRRSRCRTEPWSRASSTSRPRSSSSR